MLHADLYQSPAATPRGELRLQTPLLKAHHAHTSSRPPNPATHPTGHHSTAVTPRPPTTPRLPQWHGKGPWLAAADPAIPDAAATANVGQRGGQRHRPR